MQDLSRFEQDLTALIGKPSVLRPFVCDGSPLECEVFIVGFNPATASSTDFWSFWRTAYCFQKAAWYENYLNERRLRPLKAGKSRRNPISNTRRVIDWILAEASPVKCLETNIYSFPTEQSTDLSTSQRSTAPFDFLLSKIKPRVIVAHGDDAIAHVRSHKLESFVISVPHFARGWSEARARALGRKLSEELARLKSVPSRG